MLGGRGLKATIAAAILAALPAIRGKNLACWCKPGAPCQADVLLELASQRPLREVEVPDGSATLLAADDGQGHGCQAYRVHEPRLPGAGEGPGLSAAQGLPPVEQARWRRFELEAVTGRLYGLDALTPFATGRGARAAGRDLQGNTVGGRVHGEPD
ncbi:DUF4326 domain-containing protein [Roseomonas xinghualingensis]|uniref:DUF4326 domain-containing protein n=1 Tax=Roseomonas xinghualingensis TaxID=2986475 RepID=UPI00366C2BC6